MNSDAITQEQYDGYVQNLYYIYEYYISRSRGDQIPFRKMTNAQYDHEELQELQSQHGGMRR